MLVSAEVLEGLLESDSTMLHESERTKPEQRDSWASVGSPLSVKIHLESLVEDRISAPDCLTFDTLSKVTLLLWLFVEMVNWLPRVAFVKF